MRAIALALALAPMLFAGAARAATIDVTGNVVASGLVFGTVMAYNPFPIYPFSNLDGGTGYGTAIDGFASLAGVSPADLTITFGDLERLATSFPSGCSPTPAANCATASNSWGNADAGVPYFTVALAGSGTILSGELLSWTTTTNTAWGPNPSFGQGSGTGLVRFHSGAAPYLAEVLALTGGTGLVELSSDRFAAVCAGSDPCGFSLDARLTFVPEPSAAIFLGTGLAGLAGARRRAVPEARPDSRG